VGRFYSDANTTSADAIFGVQMIDADGIGWDEGFAFQASDAADPYTNVGLGTLTPTARVDVVGSSLQNAMEIRRGGSMDAVLVDGPYHGYDTNNGYVALRLEGSGATYGGSDWIMYASAITAPEDFLGFYNNSATDGASAGYKMRIHKGGLVDVAEGIDGIGAVDLDFGSADITDFSFTTDGTGNAEVVLPAQSIGYAEIDIVGGTPGAGSDELCLTYEHGTTNFELQACSSGGGDNVSVDSGATVDPDFQDGDVDFTYAAGVVTATVGCSGCIDATDMGTDSVAADEIAAGAVGPSELAADSLTPADLDTVAAAGASEDEYCLTYEHSTTEFAWQVCSSGGGDSITVNSSAATDPDFLNGDIDWTLTGGNSITATVACSGCVDATDLGTDACAADEIAAGAVGPSELAADSLTPADLNTVVAGGAGQDEYCLTYEHGTTEFEWQVCGSTDADAIHDNVSGEIAAIADKTVVVGADHFIIEDSAASDAKKDVTFTNLQNSMLCRTSGATATYCGLHEYIQNLNSSPTFSSATPAVAMTTQTLAAGTYLFRYYIAYSSNNTASGIGTSINMTGTVTRIVWSSRQVTTGTTASNGIADDTTGTAAAALVEGKAEYRDDTNPSSFVGVATITNPMLLVVEGLVTTSTSGNIELKIANDAGANTLTVHPETTLLLTKVL
jgi:hypothetical protein